MFFVVSSLFWLIFKNHWYFRAHKLDISGHFVIFTFEHFHTLTLNPSHATAHVIIKNNLTAQKYRVFQAVPHSKSTCVISLMNKIVDANATEAIS